MALCIACCSFPGATVTAGAQVPFYTTDHAGASAVYATVPLHLQACSQTTLSGNLYASAPAVSTDSPDAVRYTEMVMADALYCRGIAYAETGDLKGAESDRRTMVDKGTRLGYSPGATILDLSWKRLGDLYRTFLKDDFKALEAYKHVIDRTTVFRSDRPMTRPPLLAGSSVLAAATEAACDILRQQGNEKEARKLQANSLKAQAEGRKLKQGNP